MKHKFAPGLVTFAVAAITTACSSSNPLQPTNSSAASTSVSFVAPHATTPAGDSQIPWRSQPITITVANGAATASGASTYTIEVATDAGFSNIVFSNGNVPQGSGGQTGLAIGTLPGDTTYHWRVRVTTGGVTGPNSAASAFSIGTQPTVQTPAPLSPGQNGMGASPTTTLTTQNAQTSGPVGAIVYRFQVADSSAFTNIVFDSTTAQQSGDQTSIAVTARLTEGATYYWRVQAIDSTDGITTSFSTVFAFQMPVGVLFDHPWTGRVETVLHDLLASGLAGPDGSNGQAVVDQMNAMGGIFAGAVFQPHHNGIGDPTFGFGWFYVSFVPIGNGTSFYQIVEYGAPPFGD
ncbi:MAG TPA: hypothetical protein VGZ27_20160 [Vicinamibacterales bacterium]|jgi:hypothetical protein|nr:hypothetical protein [Vicinamibacterales bacterium]